MRFSRGFQAAVVLAVAGACPLWAADAPKATSSAAAVTDDAPPVSARAALGANMHQLNVDGKALSQVLDYIRQVSGTNITVNWKVLEAAGVTKDTPVTLQVRDITLRKMLQLVLDQASPATQLTFGVDSNVIEITSQDEADKVMVTKVYVVDDLVMTDNQKVTPPNMNLSSITSSGTTTGGTSGGGSGSGAGSGASGGLFTDNSSSSNAQDTDTKEKRGADLAQLVRDVVRPTIWKENGGTATIKYFSGKLIVTAPASVQEAIGGPMLPEGGQRIGM